MRFQILGPCEAYQDGSPLPLGGVKQRALLAALLLDAGRVVSADKLIDDLWGEEAAFQARHNLQELVSQLRKTLRTAGTGERIITRAPGYLIELAAGELDSAPIRRARLGGSGVVLCRRRCDSSREGR